MVDWGGSKDNNAKWKSLLVLQYQMNDSEAPLFDRQDDLLPTVEAIAMGCMISIL